MKTLTTNVPVEQRIVLDWVSWEYYEQTLREFAEGHLWVTYDEGRLELMKPSNQHKYVTKCMSRLIELFDNVVGTRLHGMGQLTCCRRHLRKGIDPDECYYLGQFPRPYDDANEAVEELEHPRPDLVFETCVSLSAVDRLSVLADLGVPEVWVYGADERLTWCALTGGEYQPVGRSAAVPELEHDVFVRFLKESMCDQAQAVFDFGDWIEKNHDVPKRGRRAK
jgi:Uma2 family endonuclease